MNLRQRLAAAYKFVRWGDVDGRARLISGIAQQQGPLWPALDIYKQQAEEYSRSAWVYVAVTRIVEAASLVPLGVYSLGNVKPTRVPEHPLEALLRNPNPITSQFELLEQTFGYLELTGNAYWFLVGNGKPEEIWSLRPDRVQVIPDEKNYVAGYKYILDTGEIDLNADEVVHFKRWHPRNDYYGLSALEAAALASQSDKAMSAYNRNFFSHDRAMPSGAVYVRGNIPDAEFEKLKREFTESFSGTQRRTAFMRGLAQDVQWVNLGLSQKEMDFIQSRDMNRDEIMSIFGVPLSMYDRNSNVATAQIGRRIFIEDTIWPKLVRVCQKITQSMMPFFGDNLVLQPEEIRDTAPDAGEIVASRGILTINEQRSRFYNVDPIPGGDTLVTPSGVTNSPDPVSPVGESFMGESEGTL